MKAAHIGYAEASFHFLEPIRAKLP